jgi:hypothetical protein
MASRASSDSLTLRPERLAEPTVGFAGQSETMESAGQP